MLLSRLSVLWLLVSIPIVLIDATFVMSRPESLGATTLPFSGWVLYTQYDKRYADAVDGFVRMQSWLNYVEVALQGVAVMLDSVKLALLVSVMTLYKTVMYFLMEEADHGKFTKHNTTVDWLKMVFIPSLFWIVFPAYVAWDCLRKLQVVGALPTGKPKRA